MGIVLSLCLAQMVNQPSCGDTVLLPGVSSQVEVRA